jgi:hypothetical protein
MTEPNIKILNQGSIYTFPIKGKGEIAKLNLPKIGASIQVNAGKKNFKSIRTAGPAFEELTGVNVEGLPNLTKGKSCKCKGRAKPVSVSNFREDPKGKEYKVCLRCGGRIK